MAQYISPSELDGLFKEVYGDSVEQLVPDNAVLIKRIKFREAEKIGDSFHQPVVLSHSHGVTYAAANAGAYSLNDHVALTVKDASVQGSQMTLREAIGYDSLSKAKGGNKKAFQGATELVLATMAESISKRLEIAMLYGQSATGIGEASSSSNTNSTTTVVTMKTAEWADGIWSGMENAKLDAYDSDDDSHVNTNAPLVVSSVDLDARTITLTGNSTDIAALDTDLAAGDAYFHFYGAKGAEMAGLDKIITNTGSLFGIDAGSFNLWKGSSYGAGSAALTMAKVFSAVSKAVVRGLNQDAVLLVNPKTFSNLMDDQADLTRYSGGSREAKNGFQTIKFMAQNGVVEVVPHNMVKEGEAFLIPEKKVRRIGASEVTFKRPGLEDRIFFDLPDRNGVELRCYADQAIFIECPAQAVKITAITNS